MLLPFDNSGSTRWGNNIIDKTSCHDILRWSPPRLGNFAIPA
jgi:hypothetical protein